MRTTLDLDDHLLTEAKKKAADEGKTLTRLIEEALRLRLEPPDVAPGSFRLELLTRGGQPVAGVDPSDRDSLQELMDGRR